MGAIGAAEVICVVIAAALNLICYLFHALPKRWRACGCPQNLLYVSNRAANSDVENESYFALSSLDGRHLTTSHFLPRPALLLLRVLELAFFVAVLVSDGTTGDKFGSEVPWPAFFTSWCFVVFGAWALVGTALTASDLVKDSRLMARAAEEGEEGEEDEEKAAAEQRKISDSGEKQEQEEEDWRRRPGGGEAAAAAACRSAPATPQRGGSRAGEATTTTTATTSEGLEAAGSNGNESTKRKASAAPSPASSSVTTASSADSRRPLTTTTPTPTTSKRRQQPSSAAAAAAAAAAASPSLSKLPPMRMDLPHKFYSLLSSVAGPSAIFVALIYWLVLRRFIERANPGKPFDPVDAMLHGGNALLACLDVSLSRVPAASSHFQVTLAYGTAYSVFIWSYERATGRFIYGRVLAWSRPSAVGFYGFALPGALLLCFVFWCLLAAGREALGKMVVRKRGARRAGGKTGAAEGNKERREGYEEEEEEGERARERETHHWTEESSAASLPTPAASTKTAKDLLSSLV